MEEYDVVIVGAGVVGCAIARELSRYRVKSILLEKEGDVGLATSFANSGVVHAGIYYPQDTYKATLCVKGNAMFDRLTDDLSVPFKRIGKIIVARSNDEEETLLELKENAELNGVPGLELVGSEEMRKKQPELPGTLGLWSPSTSIVNPYLLTIALAENAVENGFSIRLRHEVTRIESTSRGYEVEIVSKDYKGRKTNKKRICTSIIVNAGGLYSDQISAMLGIERYKIYPCRGEYLILDKSYGKLVNHLIYPVPLEGLKGLGVHITPTIDSNILIGPTTDHISDKEDTSTTREKVEELREDAVRLYPPLRDAKVIRMYAGIRSKLIPENCQEPTDFVIEIKDDLVNLLGIESPGLTAAPAIGVLVANKIGKDFDKKEDFKEKKKRPVQFSTLPVEKKEALIERNPNYGEIVCRCEEVTYQEVLDALNNPLGVKTLAGVKYRTRAGMGRCQGGFCTPRIVNIMKNKYCMKEEEIYLKDERSYLFVGKTKSLRLEAGDNNDGLGGGSDGE